MCDVSKLHLARHHKTVLLTVEKKSENSTKIASDLLKQSKGSTTIKNKNKK